MEELLERKQKLLRGDIDGSLAIVSELEEMGRKDIIKTIRSHAIILLLYLIKQDAEHRTTRSWNVSIRNAIIEIQQENQRPKSSGVYIPTDELRQILEVAYRQAINKASLEVESGRYEPEELDRQVNRAEILDRAIALIPGIGAKTPTLKGGDTAPPSSSS
jgi:hypothetical protein